jgi:hypothetical protein
MCAYQSFEDQFTWSAEEKRAARRVFDLAYQRQCAAILEKVKQMTTSATPTPSDVWEIHDYLSDQRKKVDKTFDYRYSVLLTVFSKLLSDGWLTDADLSGLQADKIEAIKRWTSL